MKNIIIPVDFSKQSEFALKAGAIIAQRNKATLHVLHMLELSESVFTKTISSQTEEMFFMLRLAEKKLAEFIERDYLKGIDVRPVIKQHKVYKEVDLVAKDLKADLIIMGSHGLTMQDGLFAGSNAEKMVRNSATPVLIIKREPKEFTLQKVILATSLTEKSIPAYQKAMNIFSSLGSTVHPVYVNLPGSGFISSKEFFEKVRNFAASGGTDKVAFIAGHTVEDGLIQYADEIDADLISVSTHARKGLNHFFNGSISEDLANHALTPVMTFKL
ncbi:universal stress protein [Dokdonia genika]|uniref:Universal stress protein n=1 Tax=Dokdonia genika TaxID=308113 RepID=A0ABV9L9V3_9FLAO